MSEEKGAAVEIRLNFACSLNLLSLDVHYNLHS